jgi:hypothetical protein
MSTKNKSGPVKRWVDEAPGAGLDAQLGEVFRAVPDEEPLSSEALASIGRRIGRDRGRGARRTTLRHLPLAFAVLVGGVGAAFAQRERPGFWHLERYFAPRVVVTASDVGPANLRKTTGVAPVSHDEPRGGDVAALVVPSLGAVEPEHGTSTRAVEPEHGRSTRAVESAPERAPETAPSPMALESELLQRALLKLRRDHDARAAIALLDEYRERFPRGVLSVEASVARIDALLLLGRREDALALLARLPIDRVGRSVELQLLRAELYAERDCGQALPDFDAVVLASGATGLAERALYGRAGCRLRLGDAAGGRGDLQTYLRRYPAGRFADQVRARLASP